MLPVKSQCEPENKNYTADTLVQRMFSQDTNEVKFLRIKAFDKDWVVWEVTDDKTNENLVGIASK